MRMQVCKVAQHQGLYWAAMDPLGVPKKAVRSLGLDQLLEVGHPKKALALGRGGTLEG